MQKGEEGLLRAKIDMQSNNGALRDPAIFRCNLEPHARRGQVQGVPDVRPRVPDRRLYRGRHARAARPPVLRPQRAVRLVPRPTSSCARCTSRASRASTLCARSSRSASCSGSSTTSRPTDWDDPRFPTVAGILRRGMTVAGLKKFILSMGASKNTNLMSWDKIWASTNRSSIDARAPRYTALLKTASCRSPSPARRRSRTSRRSRATRRTSRSARRRASSRRR